MATGVIPPGGLKAPTSGGYRAPRAGGIDMSDPFMQKLNADAPSIRLSRVSDTAAIAAQTCTAVTNLGHAASVTYAWTLPTKPQTSVIVLADDTTITVSMTPDVAGTYIALCTATFNDGTVRTATWTHVAT